MSYPFHTIGVDVHGRTSGRIKTQCPQCHERCSNKRDKSLSVNIDLAVGLCHRCGWTFHLEATDSLACLLRESAGKHPDGHPAAPPAHYLRPAAPVINHTPLSDRLVKWFVNERCIPQEVLVRMRISERRERMPQTGAKANCACFDYYEGDTLINIKYRDGAKNFKMITGAELIPYNINGILGTPEVIITEGEIDALSFAAIGRTDVVSVPAGATSNFKWLDRFIDSHFADKRCIYLAVDNDEKGILLRDELLRRFGNDRCRIVHFGYECKDANEHLVKHGATSLRIALEQAEVLPIEGVYSVGDLDSELRDLFENGLEPGAEAGWRDFDKLCTFELKRLMVVSGVPGDGKSEWIDELVVRLCLRHGWSTAFFSPENMPITYHYRKITEKLTGRGFAKDAPGMTESMYRGAKRFLSANVSHILPEKNHTLVAILEKARAAVERHGARIIVVDPVNRIEHRRPEGYTETQYISEMLNEFSAFAVRHNCLVILVAHPRKMNRNPLTNRRPVVEMYDINGSAEYFNKADYGIIVERDREASLVRVHVQKVKYKHLGQTGEAAFVYDVTSGRYYSCEEVKGAGLTFEQRVRNVEFDTTCWLPAEEESTLF